MIAGRASVAAALIATVLWVMDVLLDFDWSAVGAVTGRACAIACAVAVAAFAYQRWSQLEHRTPLTHASVAAGLIGGASLTASAVSATGDAVFGSAALATLGVAALLAAVLCELSDRRATR